MSGGCSGGDASSGGDFLGGPGRETDPAAPQQPGGAGWGWAEPARFPEITEEVIATYRDNYSFSPADGADPAASPAPPTEAEDPAQRGEKRKSGAGWFHLEEDRSTHAYVSGLPPDTTLDEFVRIMSRFGIIMRDPQTEELKVKLYRDERGNLKGDGLCCYLKRESVQLAVQLLDEDEIRGHRLRVEVAKFQLKGKYDASKKKKKCKDYKKKLILQQKQLDWRPERRAGPGRMSHERVVILKNMFRPVDFEDDPLVLNDIKEDLRVECSKFGHIKKLLLFDRHPDGVASVLFRDPEEADYCIQTLHKRWFGGRQITAQVWDGTTDYQVEETSRERDERLRGWEAFLNDPEANSGVQHSESTNVSERATDSKTEHFPEYQRSSRRSPQETVIGMTLEGPIVKLEMTEDGRQFEEDSSRKEAKGNEQKQDVKESCADKECGKASPRIVSKGDCPRGEKEEVYPKNDSEEGSPKRELQENGPEEKCKNRDKERYEYNSMSKGCDDPKTLYREESHLQKGSEGKTLERESERDFSMKLSEEIPEKLFEKSSLEKDFGKNSFDNSASNLLEKRSEDHDVEKSGFTKISKSMLDGEDSEREYDEHSDKEQVEDVGGKVFKDGTNEKKDSITDEIVHGKEQEEADEDLYKSDIKEDAKGIKPRKH